MRPQAQKRSFQKAISRGLALRRRSFPDPRMCEATIISSLTNGDEPTATGTITIIHPMIPWAARRHELRHGFDDGVPWMSNVRNTLPVHRAVDGD